VEEVKRVLAICGIESSCAEFAHSAATVARLMGSELVLLTVIYNPFGLKGLSLPRPSLQKDYERLLEKIKNDMQEIVRTESLLQNIFVKEIIREGKPVDEILTVIREENVGLMFLPAHQQTWLESILAGGYNKTLLRKMPCSILFLKKEPKAIEEEEEEAEEKEEE
jgi:nucleotide-binding universal stress UspA family protein